uniref:Uncharacterized protein n=1 Tax=Pararge aegeria TaxID=116150 RepID=S4PCE4_9NEOP
MSINIKDISKEYTMKKPKLNINTKIHGANNAIRWQCRYTWQTALIYENSPKEVKVIESCKRHRCRDNLFCRNNNTIIRFYTLVVTLA